LQLEQGGMPFGATGDWPARLKGYLGADVEDSGDFVNVKDVRAGSPAYEQGLSAKDKILALDGARVNKESFEARIASKRPGDIVRIAVFRNDDLRTIDIKLSAVVDAPYRIVQLPSATDAQKRIYQSWLNGK
jgi:predicted metalloprotease with PDZ domain